MVRDDAREFSGAPVVQAVPDADWDGGAYIEARYLHPSGQRVRATTYVYHGEFIPHRGRPFLAHVSTKDPTSLEVVGDFYPGSGPWEASLLAVPILAVVAARRHTARRSRKLATSDAVAFQMRAQPSNPGWWGRRWRLHLYALDPHAGATPVCTVPLIAAPADPNDLIVEVKGSPRPWGRVVVRDPDADEILWPSGRCLRGPGWRRRSLEPGQELTASWAARALLAGTALAFLVGLVIDLQGEDSIDVEDRQYEIPATVVDPSVGDGVVEATVSYSWLGTERTGVVNPTEAVDVGDRIDVFVDPQHPAWVWAPGEYAPGGDGGVWFYLGAFALGVAAVIVQLVHAQQQRVIGRAGRVPPPPPITHGRAPSLLPPPPPPPAWPRG
jgi:hypothetical protein